MLAAAFATTLLGAGVYLSTREDCEYPVAAWCAFAAPIHAPEDLAGIPGVTLKYFTVHGRTLEAIRTELKEHGPADESGTRRSAAVRWTLSWKWPDELGRPDFVHAASSAAIEVILPSLADAGDLPANDRREWDRYFKALFRHELGHVANAFGAALLPGIQIQKAAADGGGTVSGMNAVGWKVSETCRELDRSYDERSDHGALTGAAF
jgi:predicted secreted Zn-dependent protease